jgi:toxin HigB-1
MIHDFASKETERVWQGEFSKRLPTEIQQKARMKLRMLHAAHSLNDLRSPPANHLEALAGNRLGQHSIRINGQWRLCFVWKDGHASSVEIVDYH